MYDERDAIAIVLVLIAIAAGAYFAYKPKKRS